MVKVMEKKVKINKNYAQYMPLYNLKGLKSSITPFFGGDIKLDHHHYLLEPTTENDLFSNHMSRNMIFTIDDQMYFLNGDTHLQQQDDVDVSFGLLYQKVERKNAKFKLNTLSFIALDDDIELHKITIENTSDKPFELDTITAIPIYARSADNLRDHRHVTSLLNRVTVTDNSIEVKPTLSFDERGHTKNTYTYVISAYNEHLKQNRFITSIEDFLAGGSFSYPKGIYQRDVKIKDGYEVMGGIGFEKIVLHPNESTTFIVSMGIFSEAIDVQKVVNKYLSIENINHAFNEVKAYFENESEKLNIDIVSNDVNMLLKWVRIQPELRRLFGNSYLPHHDYGRGGRGLRYTK